jgi:hypothetical protein
MKATEQAQKTAEIRELKEQPSQEWIDMLQTALERAKSGETVGGAIIESAKGAVRHSYSGLKNRFEFTGLLQLLISQILS